MFIRRYKVTFINKKLGKKIEIIVIGDNKQNAIYHAKGDLSNRYLYPELFELSDGAVVLDEPVYVKDYSGALSKILTPENSMTCPKCNGSGYIDKFQQYHGGVCYTCGGYGKVLKTGTDVYTISDLKED